MPTPCPLTVVIARDLCRTWQERLRLQDWDVTVLVEHLDGAFGKCDTHMPQRKAIIRLDDSDRDTPYITPGQEWDWEQTLVHELLHIHMVAVVGAKFDWDSPVGIAAEQCIEAVATALVRLSR